MIHLKRECLSSLFLLLRRIFFELLYHSTTALSSSSCSLSNLSDKILLVSQEENPHLLSLSRFQIAVLQQQIMTNTYSLSPLQVKFIKKENLIDSIVYNLSETPDYMRAWTPLFDQIL